MTGFGRGQADVDGGRVVVELRSVNNRFHDLRVHLAPELAGAEAEVDRKLRERFSRGRVELSARIVGRAPVGVRVDRELARSCLRDLEAVRREMGLVEPVSINVLAAVPQVFVQEPFCEPEAITRAVLEAVEQAITSAEAMQRREAEALALDFEGRLELIGRTIDQVDAAARLAGPAILERLRARIRRLVEDDSHQIDEARLTQEAALAADRSDVAEELTRLRSHVAQFRTIAGEGDLVGRRLDFLLQEMAREAGTIGAKCQDAELQHLIVDLRGELSRMREQVQNIE
jgi:uncharacterized protein (TIGR00255 family)